MPAPVAEAEKGEVGAPPPGGSPGTGDAAGASATGGSPGTSGGEGAFATGGSSSMGAKLEHDVPADDEGATGCAPISWPTPPEPAPLS